MADSSPVTPSADVPRRRTDKFIAKLAEQVGARVGASTIFGAPVERDGVTVIPVASVRLAFGGGAGRGGDPKGQGEGEGGGAIGRGTVTGYIELKDGRSRFVPAVDPARMLALVGATVLGGLLIARRQRTARRTAGRRPR